MYPLTEMDECVLCEKLATMEEQAMHVRGMGARELPTTTLCSINNVSE